MRIVTFNLWHGLSPSNPLAFEALEPTTRRKLRESEQVRVLKEASPDFVFLQEVNPVSDRVQELGQALNLSTEYQPDLVGVKVFGIGLPLNLNSGLVIGAGHGHGLKRVQAISLSRPGFNWVRKWGSWQLREERFALLCESLVPDVGRILLINTHLHHGLESDPEFEKRIDEWTASQELNSTFTSELKERIRKADARRMNEMAFILRTIAEHEKRYSAVVLCGDLNSTPGSELFHALREIGFQDSWEIAHPQDPGYTFDRLKNEANHLLQSRFPISLMIEDLTFSSEVKAGLMNLAREQENRPRRIDYVWVRSRNGRVKVKGAQLLGAPDAEGLAPSDHFGVQVDLEV
ncbi:MAG: endonuclease/exonuclease/phosphatase family protein [Bdellovibrionales bacterium]